MDTSWQSASKWYDQTVGASGHYYHKNIIIPKLLDLFHFESVENPKLLDIGCGQGIFARQLPKNVSYLGLDASNDLLQSAKKYDKAPNHRYQLQDVTKSFTLKESDFSHAIVVLALQNMQDPSAVFKNISKHLRKGGQLFIVLNHPCFRIPRQSSWEIDTKMKLQFRRINRYMSPLKIPIQVHPSKQDQSSNTWSFHHPLSDYTKWLKESGFVIDSLEEWISDKASVGAHSTMENRAREEFPLFLTIVATLK